jgi:predicted DNA-binding protein (UPF0251 family)
MVRPKKIKLVNFEPNVTYFKPRAVPLAELEEVELTIDELETMRLANIENFGQEKAAKKMGIHQSTFQRTLTRAREKITDALINGKAIKIHGGDYKMPNKDGTGPRNDSKGPKDGRGQGKGRASGTGIGKKKGGKKGNC